MDWEPETKKMQLADVFPTAVNIFLIVALALSVTLLMTLYLDRLPQNITVGTVANRDLYVDKNYDIINEKETKRLRDEAAQGVKSVYDYDPSLMTEAQKRIHDAFESARLFIAENTLLDTAAQGLSVDLEAQLMRESVEKMGVSVADDTYVLLRKSDFSPVVEEMLQYVVGGSLGGYIVSDKQEFAPVLQKGFVLRTLSSDHQVTEESLNQTDNFYDLDEAKKNALQIKWEDVATDNKISRGIFKNVKELAAQFIKVNINYNLTETEARRVSASNNVPNVSYKYQRGELIIGRGDRYEPHHLTVIAGIHKTRLQTNRTIKFLGVFMFVNLVLLVVYYYAAKYIRKFKPNRQDLVFLGLVLIFFLMVLRVGAFLSSSIRDTLLSYSDIHTFYYALPVAAGAMLIRFILNSETALIFAVIMSLFAGIFLESNLQITAFYLISGVYAAHAIAHVDKRSTVLLSGLYTGIFNALVILSLNLISYISIADGSTPAQILINCLFGFTGGLLTAMVVLILTPICEALFNYTTDIKLLELANVSHPLLKEMIVRSPGTYHHSQIVGILAEAGAQSIGANPLLARVASYYHDIGKMKKPQYFIENQRGENPHDALAPSMSALIVATHVKDGIEMAAHFKLPQKIAAMIPQHQGTKLISYFYSKARKLEKPGDMNVSERDYRYPGPKPQTREAGVIMLADTVEAATRALAEKTPAKIQSTVQNLVNQHFVDEQLDECDLTLRDLHRISGAFIKILNGIYHQRIEYPEGVLATNKAELQVIPTAAGSDETVSEQSSSSPSNISPLFGGKGKKNSPSSGS